MVRLPDPCRENLLKVAVLRWFFIENLPSSILAHLFLAGLPEGAGRGKQRPYCWLSIRYKFVLVRSSSDLPATAGEAKKLPSSSLTANT